MGGRERQHEDVKTKSAPTVAIVQDCTRIEQDRDRSKTHTGTLSVEVLYPQQKSTSFRANDVVNVMAKSHVTTPITSILSSDAKAPDKLANRKRSTIVTLGLARSLTAKIMNDFKRTVPVFAKT